MILGIRGDYTSLNDVKDNENNPFVKYLVLSEKFVLKRFQEDEASKLIEKENKELSKVGLEIGKRRKIRTSPYTQLYWGKEIDFMKLSPTTLRILFYIFYRKVEYGRDSIVTSPKHISEELLISKSSTYTSFLELINNKIIDKRAENVWWINPAYFYCGDRINIKTK